jgi:hypothetical protein
MQKHYRILLPTQRFTNMHTVSIKGFKRGKKAALLLTSLLLANVAATGASLQPDTTLIVARPATKTTQS